MERRLVDEYFATVDELLAGLAAGNHGLAVEIASLPTDIRGFGHVKEAHLARVRTRWSDLMARWRAPATKLQSAA